MNYIETEEISNRIKRISDRVKNSGDMPLAQLGLQKARKAKRQFSEKAAKAIEQEYLWILKEKYLPNLPKDKIVPTIKSMAGYDEPSGESQNSPVEGTTDVETPNDNSTDIRHNQGEYIIVVENVNYQTEVTLDSKFDADSAIDTLNNNAEDHYTGKCATYVREALEAGGINTIGHPEHAKDYGSFLEQRGFEAVDNSQIDNPQKGDIVVIQPTDDGKHESGHIAMYNGLKWVSDKEQRDYSAGLKSDFKLYRHQ